MEKWKKYKLGDIIELNYGKSLTANTRVPGKIPVFSSSGITGSHNVSLVNSASVIVGRKGTVGSVFYNQVPFYCIDTAYYILPNQKKYDLKFLYYMLKTIGLEHLNEDSAVPGLNRNTAYNQEVSLPPLPTQSRIASILSSLDDKIELNRRMNQTLESMAQALFNHYFVDNIDADNLPEGWAFGKIRNICFVQNGYAFKSKDFANEGSIGVIKIRNINNNIVDIHTTQYINEVVLNTLDRKFKVIPQDILIAMTGAEVGKIGIVPNNSKSLWLNQRVGNIKEENGYGKYFTYILLTSESYQNELQTTAMGSAQPNISASDIENIKVLIPEKQKVHDFEIEVKPMFQKICQNLEESSILASIRDTLLPKLMSGEIDVEEK